MTAFRGESLTERCTRVREQLRNGSLPPSYVLDQWIGQVYQKMASAIDEGDQVQCMGHKIELLTLKKVRWSMPKYEWQDL